MVILSHRGFWNERRPKNSEISFNYSIDNGFGTETDVRDLSGTLVISHDIPDSKSLLLDLVLERFVESQLMLALNIKADGLQFLLKASLDRYSFSNYFVFDMSIPDTLSYLNMGFNVFCRQSEYEPIVPFYSRIQGVWLDAFDSNWYDMNLIMEHLGNGKKVCVVSSELHGREYKSLWNALYSTELIKNPNLILCTDYPLEAKVFFEV